MKRILLLPLLLLSGLCHADDNARPNFVLVLAHDLGRDWLSCYGAEHRTPHIDQLASEGIRYETAWSMPDGELSYRTLISGLYPCHQADGKTALVKLLTDDGYTRAEFNFDGEFQLPAKRPFVLFCQLPKPTEDFPSHVTQLDTLIGKLARDTADDATFFLLTSGNGSAVGGRLNDNSYPAGKGARSSWGAHVPFIVRAPFLSGGNRVCRDLVDFTDLYPTLLELAGIDQPGNLNLDGKSLVPSLRGSDDPFEKRNWIFSQIGDFRMVRDWHHFVDSKGNFHDLEVDPIQEQEVSPLDKQAPHRRERLQMILDRFPENAAAPFPEFREVHP